MEIVFEGRLVVKMKIMLVKYNLIIFFIVIKIR